MIHPENGRRGIVQVKTGSTPVDLSALAGAVVDEATDTYAFATSGRYSAMQRS
jgi:D-alanyl-D-alanine carboxypeptidase